MKKSVQTISLIFAGFIIGVFVRTTFAGSLTPSGAPASSMYTLDGIYNKIINNATNVSEGAQSFTTPGLIAPTFHTLKQIYESIPTLDPTKILLGTTYMGVSGVAPISGGLPKTGQTQCWDTIGTLIPCAGTGQDGEYQKGFPIGGARFTDNGNNTITDRGTGLMWKKCSEGQSGADCSGGSIITTSWAEGLSICEADTTAGFTDWRLPNINELFSLVAMVTIDPSIDTTFFPNTIADFYWSSTTFTHTDNSQAEFIAFDDGVVSEDNKIAPYYTRCVR